MNPVWSKWVPGVLSRRQLLELCSEGFITGVQDLVHAIDHSSIDLHLTDEGYELVRGSVKPFGGRFLHTVLDEGLLHELAPEADGSFVLQSKRTYLFRLHERLQDLHQSSFWGQATAKSSVGRLDVLARLVVDGMHHYEAFTPNALGRGSTDMFVEITPITFPVRVKKGVSVNQLRLFYGHPSNCILEGEEIARTCFAGAGEGLHNLTVHLENESVHGVNGCGFCAEEERIPDDAIPLWKDDRLGKPAPERWWRLVQSNGHHRLRIRKNSFYILKSRERLTLPPGVAVYARAIDEEIGEMRIHYAGFAHPCFGWERKDGRIGTPLIFEVRGHDVDVNLRNAEVLARLRFSRMSEDVEPTGEESYNEQELDLSKYFGDWSSPPQLLPNE